MLFWSIVITSYYFYMNYKYPTEICIFWCILIVYGSSFTINTNTQNHPELPEIIDPIVNLDSNSHSTRLLESIQISA